MKGAIQGMDGGKLLIGLKLTGMENAASLEKILTDLYPPTYFLKKVSFCSFGCPGTTGDPVFAGIDSVPHLALP
jgi:hypothetical protein